MPCFHPLSGFKARNGGLVFNPAGTTCIPLVVPCGQCIGCRIDYSKQWAARMVHESRCHADNQFITLTYDDLNLPTGSTLVKRHTQLFLKSYRKLISPRKIRYYLCGEYGETNLRPHYHVVLFGHRFDDQTIFAKADGYFVYTSDTLTSLWGRGHASIGEVNAETCAYTARYVTKKINGDAAQNHYERLSLDGEISRVIPEFSTQSRRPGIGATHFDNYRSDLYPSDYIVLNGKKAAVPRYYDRLLDRLDPAQLEIIKRKRLAKARVHRDNQTPERLATREECLRSKLKTLTRKL